MNFNFVNGGSKGWMQVSIFELYLLQVKFTEEATHYLSSLYDGENCLLAFF